MTYYMAICYIKILRRVFKACLVFIKNTFIDRNGVIFEKCWYKILEFTFELLS